MADYCSDLAKDALASPVGFAEYLRHSKEEEIRGLISEMYKCQELNDLVNRTIKEIYSYSLAWYFDSDKKKAWHEAIDRFRFLESSVKSENEADNKNNDHEQRLFNLFPVFNKHSEFLKAKGYYKLAKEKITWVHGGNLLLAGYFGMIQSIPGNPRCMWADIERAFDTKHLSQHYSDYETMRKGKTSKHEKYDKELRDLVSGKNLLINQL